MIGSRADKAGRILVAMLVGALAVLVGGAIPGLAGFLNPNAATSGTAAPDVALQATDSSSSALATSSSSATASPGPSTSVSTQPVSLVYYVDPTTPAARQVAQLQGQGRTEDANQLRKIADQPIAYWVGGDVGQMAAQVAEYSGRAAAAKRQPLIVAYDIPHRDCGSYSAGGAGDAGAYRSWIGALAGALGHRPATVILEPDAIPHAVTGCVSGAQAGERYQLLAAAVSTLKASGPVQVYLDAGGPGFVSDLDGLGDALRRSGVAAADGFAINVSNFNTTAEDVAYGKQLSAKLGGKHFVIDTSRNGRGPVGGDTNGGPSWCNPPDRGLGQPPTTRTGQPLVDAFLWIKRPGESDGSCRDGEPSAGTWWLDYALGLARRAV